MPDDGALYDDDAGPLVRPYAVAGGRTPDERMAAIDRAAQVVTVDIRPESHTMATWTPEHRTILQTCERSSVLVAELAVQMGRPLGVIRVLVGDLRTHGVVEVIPPSATPDVEILRRVYFGLQQYQPA